MTIAVTGSVAFDYISYFSGDFIDHILPDKLEKLSVSFLMDSMRKERGGVAGNIAYSMALLAQPCLLMAAVGHDSSEYIKQLLDMGIDTSSVIEIPDELSASAFIFTDHHNRLIAGFVAGAMAQSRRVSFRNQNDKNIQLAIISPNALDAMEQYVFECKDLGIPYVYDPSHQIPSLDSNLLCDGIYGAYMLIGNDYEIEAISRKAKLSIEEIKNAVQVLVVTRGKTGSSIYVGGDVINVPAVVPQQVVDPTGAGDAYRAGLLTGYLQGLNWRDAGQLGAVTATYALEAVGTQKHSFTISEFATRYHENFKPTNEIEAFFS